MLPDDLCHLFRRVTVIHLRLQQKIIYEKLQDTLIDHRKFFFFAISWLPRKAKRSHQMSINPINGFL